MKIDEMDLAFKVVEEQLEQKKLEEIKLELELQHYNAILAGLKQEVRGIPMVKDGVVVGKVSTNMADAQAQLKEVRKELEVMAMQGSEVKQETVVRSVINKIGEGVDYRDALQKTLRDRLVPVLSQEVRVDDDESKSDQPINATSPIFEDLSQLAKRIERQNEVLLEIIEDLEI